MFQPIGFVAFGIHAENDALRVGEDPTTLTARTVDRYRGQLRRLGAAWDWGQALALALGSGNVRRHLEGREPVQVVHVPDRLINLVTAGR